jgi:hypothetical protein
MADKPVQRDEIIGALTLVILFIAVMIGREAGNFYASYEEMKSLKVLFDVDEGELSKYLRGVIEGGSPTLSAGVTITSPAVEDGPELVTEIPDYARRWLISVTISPIKVRQPSVSDVELELLVEGETVVSQMLSFPKEKVSYLGYVERQIDLSITDVPRLRMLLQEATNAHGGEVEVQIRGRALAHLWFLESWLPFTTTRCPLLDAPFLIYEDSTWRSLEGSEVGELRVGQVAVVSVRLRNPTRFHSLSENMTCIFMRAGTEVASVIKEAPLAAGSSGVYVFQIPFMEAGEYRYELSFEGRIILAADDSPSLRVVN